MDYRQGRVTTLHDLTGTTPDAPVEESAVVVPIAGDSHAAVTPAHIFETLATVDPGEVIVPLRAPRAVATSFREWLADFDLSTTVLWCDSPAIADLLAAEGLDGTTGKGRDVWLGVGVAADRADYVAVHDADATTYSAAHVPRLLAPLADDYGFVKGYYARVEDGRLYGRLARLFVAPLLRALSERSDHPLVDYLSAFRYPLAGEFAFTADAARQVRAQRAWGLEIGVLGEAYRTVGVERSAQVDLGVHEHDHRPVRGDTGLSSMSEQVGAALFRALEEAGVETAYETLASDYRDAGDRLVEQYATEAAFNGLEFDPDAEREQVRAYESGIGPPGEDTRLPAWTDSSLSPSAVVDAARVPDVSQRNG